MNTITIDCTRQLQKRCCERQVNVLGRPKIKKTITASGDLSPKLYTCLREAASAKAGRLLYPFIYSVSEDIAKFILSEFPRDPYHL